MRTTLDLDASILDQLRERQRREGKTLGQLVSELLARALDETEPATSPPFDWVTTPMAARVDLEDADAVHRLLDDR